MRFLLWLAPSLLAAQTNWTTPPEVEAAGYKLRIAHEGCAKTECIVLVPPANPPAQPPGALMETLDPRDVAGHRVRIRALVRLENPGPGDRAQLLFRVDRPDDVLGFYDSMGDRPITSVEWQPYEIVGEVAEDATSILLGVRSYGKARVWVDGLTVDVLPPAGAETDAARKEIEKAYARIDAAYAEGNVDAIAAATLPDAAVVVQGNRAPLAGILADIREQITKGMRYRSVTAVTAVRVTGAAAVVWVNNQSAAWRGDTPHTVLSVSRDEWIKSGEEWKLKQSTLIASNVPR